jgi:6-phosphogluconolactonase
MNSAVTTGIAQPTFCGFRSAEDLYAALAEQVCGRLAAGVARDGCASLVASGGTTPGPLYDLLAQSQAPWEDVSVTLSDERWTDPSSKLSNENLVRARLLTANAAASHLAPFKTAHAYARDAEATVNAAIAAIRRPFDVVLLGMGIDGHTASLIPGAQGLARALDRGDPALVRAVEPPNLAAMGERMTLTLRGILGARWIVLLIRGEEKLTAYRRALAGTDILETPVRAVLHQTDVPVSVFWSGA